MAKRVKAEWLFQVYANFDFSSFSLISYNATVALLGPFRSVSDLQYVSVKFKRLIINVLEMSPKSHIYAERVVGCKYRKQRGRKQINSLTVVELDAMATADGRGSLPNKKRRTFSRSLSLNKKQ